ncbi:MAG: LacI family DNA-binding transcriptional regulator [Candidatus Puniceispirillales bacterium]
MTGPSPKTVLAPGATKITANDVAARAGVSQSAVSRVFTPGASVSPQTREKVLKVAMELGYRPNSLARAMVLGKSRMIGLVVAYLQNQFYPEAIEKLSKAFQERGYHLLVFMTSKTAGDVSPVVEEILDYQVDGIIAASVAMSSDLLQRCAAAGVPVVSFNRSQDDESLSAVTSENYVGGRKVAEYLIATGHERIAYIAGWEGASTQRDREAGFIDALQRAGRSLYCRGVGDFVMEDAREVTRTMFADGIDKAPDAIFVANDHMAFAVMDTLRSELGIAIPEQVSVVGYDDVPAASWAAYDLTTVRQPTNRMVAATVDILLEQIESDSPPPSRGRQIKIDGPLIIRKSSRQQQQ